MRLIGKTQMFGLVVGVERRAAGEQIFAKPLQRFLQQGLGHGEALLARQQQELGDIGRENRHRAAIAGDPEWAALLKDGAFALGMTRTLDGVVKFRGTVTGIQPQKLDAGLFVPPADFASRSLDDITKMLKSAPDQP